MVYGFASNSCAAANPYCAQQAQIQKSVDLCMAQPEQYFSFARRVKEPPGDFVAAKAGRWD
jgi:hypothetical protein